MLELSFPFSSVFGVETVSTSFSMHRSMNFEGLNPLVAHSGLNSKLE